MLLDTNKRKVFYGWFIKKQYDVSEAEIRILQYMADHDMHSIPELVEKCKIQSPNALKAQICRLRHKGVDIQTMRGAGYRLKSDIRINGDY